MCLRPDDFILDKRKFDFKFEAELILTVIQDSCILFSIIMVSLFERNEWIGSKVQTS